MDTMKQLYVSDVRPFRDRPDIVVRGRWYWSPANAKVIPYAHCFGSFTHDPNGYIDDPPVGELRAKVANSYKITNPRLTGQNWCGSEEVWTQGALYAAVGTPAVDAEGIAVCCQTQGNILGGLDVEGAGVFVGPNGVMLGGELVAGDQRRPVVHQGGAELVEGNQRRPVVHQGGAELVEGNQRRPVVHLGGAELVEGNQRRPVVHLGSGLLERGVLLPPVVRPGGGLLERGVLLPPVVRPGGGLLERGGMVRPAGTIRGGELDSGNQDEPPVPPPGAVTCVHWDGVNHFNNSFPPGITGHPWTAYKSVTGPTGGSNPGCFWFWDWVTLAWYSAGEDDIAGGDVWFSNGPLLAHTGQSGACM